MSTASRSRCEAGLLPLPASAGRGRNCLGTSASNISILLAFAPCELRQCPALDQGVEVLGLLVVGEPGLTREHLVEQELLRLRRAAVDVKLLDPRLVLRLRQKFFQDRGDGVFLAWLGFPQRGNDQLVAVGTGWHVV